MVLTVVSFGNGVLLQWRPLTVVSSSLSDLGQCRALSVVASGSGVTAVGTGVLSYYLKFLTAAQGFVLIFCILIVSRF